EIAAFHPAELGKVLPQYIEVVLFVPIVLSRPEQQADPPHPPVRLRARHKRPPRCASEKRDECAPPHSITSSARASRLGGTVRPSAFAVLRLITISIFVARWTGRSAGFSPLRMRAA